jgi:hypothetical protein
MMSSVHNVRRILAFFCFFLAATAEIKSLLATNPTHAARAGFLLLIILIVITLVTNLILWNPAFTFQPDIEPTPTVRKVVWSVACILLLLAIGTAVICSMEKPVNELCVIRASFRFAAFMGWYNCIALFCGPGIVPDKLRLFIQSPFVFFKSPKKLFIRLTLRDSRNQESKTRQKPK